MDYHAPLLQRLPKPRARSSFRLDVLLFLALLLLMLVFLGFPAGGLG
jgi:hypothetical protein